MARTTGIHLSQFCVKVKGPAVSVKGRAIKETITQDVIQQEVAPMRKPVQFYYLLQSCIKLHLVTLVQLALLMCRLYNLLVSPSPLVSDVFIIRKCLQASRTKELQNVSK